MVIIRIAKTELEKLFYSPVAWLILGAFAIQVGLDFTNILVEIAKMKALGHQITFSITAGVVLGNGGYFETIQRTLYLYIPLLTMGLMSREYSTGSIKLLYSSPVNSREIVMGKFLSMKIYALALVIILALPLCVLLYGVPNIDFPLFLTGLLGLFLLILTYCSIGLFMSVLTSYQVVAAVATLTTLAFLNYVGGIGQEYATVRDITYWLAINGRASELVGGLICSDDVIYFVTVIFLFLFLSVVKLQNSKSGKSKIVKSMRYIYVIVVAIIIGYISSLPSNKSFYDATRVNQRTLSLASQKVMKELTGPLKITTYLNIFDKDFDVASPKSEKTDYSRFSLYTRFKPEIEMSYVHYYSIPKDTAFYNRFPGKNIDEIAKEIAQKKRFNFKRLVSLNSLPLDVQRDLKKENYNFVRIIERENGSRSFLRLYNDMFRNPSESEISAALKKLVQEPVKVGFVFGHGERSADKTGDRDYSIFASKRSFRNSMVNQGFDVVNVNLNNVDEVPKNIGILFISDMARAMTPKEYKTLDKFIERGGNLMIMADINREKTMNPLLSRFNLKLEPGILVQNNSIYNPDLIFSLGKKEGAKIVGGIFRNLSKYKNMRITMPSSVALKKIDDESSFKFYPLLATDSTAAWIEKQTLDFINDTVVMDSGKGESYGSYITAMALTRDVNSKQQRILVFGDSDCLSNSELMLSDRQGYRSVNFSMVPSSFRWLCYGEFPVSAVRSPNVDTTLNISPNDLPIIKILYLGLIPIILVLLGIVIFFRRNKY